MYLMFYDIHNSVCLVHLTTSIYHTISIIVIVQVLVTVVNKCYKMTHFTTGGFLKVCPQTYKPILTS